MTLSEIQAGFASWLAGADNDVAPLVDQRSHRGLQVYRHAVGATLVDCLRDSFEKTLAWLGDDAFDAVALTHATAHRSVSWTLSDYGAEFEASLAARYPDDPEVAELAWIDWSLRCAFDAADTRPLHAAGLADVDWDRATMTFAPTLVLREIATNAPAIWNALSAGQKPSAAKVLDRASVLAVWRQGLSPRFRTMDGVEHAALACALAGEPFWVVCDAVARADLAADPAERSGAILGQWIGDGLLASVGS